MILSYITFQIQKKKKQFQIPKWINYGEIYRIYFREKANNNVEFLEKFKTILQQNVRTFIEDKRSDFNSFTEFVNCIKKYIEVDPRMGGDTVGLPVNERKRKYQRFG